MTWNYDILEVASMVVALWTVAFLCSGFAHVLHVKYTKHSLLYVSAI